MSIKSSIYDKLEELFGAGVPAEYLSDIQDNWDKLAESVEAGLTGDVNFDGYVKVEGTPVANQVAYFTDADTITGESNLYWDAVNNRLGIGTASPDTLLEIKHATADADHELLKLTEASWSASSGKYKSIVWEDDTSNVAAIGAQYNSGTGIASIDFHSIYNSGYKTTSDVVMRINGNGNVGIGVDPSVRLHLSGVNGGRIRLDDTGTGGDAWDIISAQNTTHGVTDGSLLFYNVDVGDTKLTILPNGNVGIGVNPSRKLHVYGSGAEGGAGWFECVDNYNTLKLISGSGATFFQQAPSTGNHAYYDNLGDANSYFRTNAATVTNMALATNGYIYFFDATILQHTNTQELRFDGGSSKQWRIISTINGATDGELTIQHTTDSFVSNFTNALTCDTDGKVGIGTITPGVDLHVYNTTAATIKVQSDTNPWVAGLSLQSGAGAGESAGIYSYGTTGEVRIGGLNTNYYPTFYANNAEKMRITADGYVGIGTTSPDYQLSVYGDNNADSTRIGIDNLDQRLEFGAYYESGVGQYAYIQSYNNARTSTLPLSLNPNGGDVGIGTTTPGATLEINDTSSAKLYLHSTADMGESVIKMGLGGSGDRDSYIDLIGDDTYTTYGLRLLRGGGANGSSNLYHRGTGDFRIQNVDAADLILATQTSARITIKSDGKVGVGTGSPTELLDVNSDAIRVRTSQTPASAGAAGDAGMICWDSNYLYVCVSNSTWKRVALSTW